MEVNSKISKTPQQFAFWQKQIIVMCTKHTSSNKTVPLAFSLFLIISLIYAVKVLIALFFKRGFPLSPSFLNFFPKFPEFF